MARLKLVPLDNYRFQYRTAVKVRDVNYGGHLGNDAVVSLLHEARMDFFKSLGCTELDLGDGETGIIVNELQVSYRAEGHLLDEIVIHSEVTKVKTTSFRICHRITRGEETLVLAEIGVVAFSYKQRRIVELPVRFCDQITSG